MADYLLHENAVVQCAHPPGQVELTVTDPRVKVSGHKIVTLPGPHTVSKCTLPSPPAANGPCVTAAWTSAATRVKASGRPVLLKDSQATCAPTGTGVTVISTQTRVKGT